MLVQINYRSFFCLIFFSKKSTVVFLYVLSFLKRKYERKQFGEGPEDPLKFKAEHSCLVSVIAVKGGAFGSNVRLFLIARGLCACGDGTKQELFCLRFGEIKTRAEDPPLFCFYKVCSNSLLKFLLPTFLFKEKYGQRKVG